MARHRPPAPDRPTALVAVEDGPVARAIVALLVDEEWVVQRTAARGQALLAAGRDGGHTLVVAELSRVGEVGLRGLRGMAADRSTVLLLPGGLGGPSASDLGVVAVLAEDDIGGLRAVLRDTAGVRRSDVVDV